MSEKTKLVSLFLSGLLWLNGIFSCAPVKKVDVANEYIRNKEVNNLVKLLKEHGQRGFGSRMLPNRGTEDYITHEFYLTTKKTKICYEDLVPQETIGPEDTLYIEIFNGRCPDNFEGSLNRDLVSSGKCFLSSFFEDEGLDGTLTHYYPDPITKSDFIAKIKEYGSLIKNEAGLQGETN